MNLAPDQLVPLIPVAVLALALDLFCIVDIVRRRHVLHLPRFVWAIIVLASFPFGAILYLVLGRGAKEPPAELALTQSAAAIPSDTAGYPRHAATAPTDPARSPANHPALRVEHVTKTFASGAGIRDISFTAQDRAVTAVIGPNGAGKTVLFSVIAGLVHADSGSARPESATARVAYCPDVPQFEPWLTAREVVSASLVLSQSTGTLSASAALEQCGLGAVSERRVSDFSRGMLQRLGIAAALVLDPDILILDEPNSALDPIGRADVRALIAQQKQHRCIVLSSHLLSEVEQLADAIVVISEGQLVASGTTAEILRHRLSPVWTIRLGSPSPTPLDELAAALPGVTLTQASDTLITASFESFAAAETQLTRLVALLAAPIIEVTLQDRDLDASFARIVQNQEQS